MGGAATFIFQIGEPDYTSQPMLTVLASTDVRSVDDKCGVQAWSIGN